MKLLITGASGMVGTELKKFLSSAYTPSSSDLDLTSATKVREYLFDEKFNYVIHLAAYVGSLHDNIENRTLYFDKNIIMNTFLTKYAYESGVKNFLGILSTCIYPDNISSFPIHEDRLHDGAPHKDLMSYAYAKRSHAVQIQAYKDSYGLNYNYLVPCNLYGKVAKSHENRSHFVNDLIFKIIKAQNKGDNHITLFGDGTPMRQFMHAEDFAKIISIYFQNDLKTSFNVAPNMNMSVNDIARVALEACDAKQFKILYDDSKPNGQIRKDVDTTHFENIYQEFKFKTLHDGISEIYKFYKGNQ
tara:strand:- start:148 stop:1053 length:906 start_codon:yes stop_codon:yes gene_type:complete